MRGYGVVRSWVSVGGIGESRASYRGKVVGGGLSGTEEAMVDWAKEAKNSIKGEHPNWEQNKLKKEQEVSQDWFWRSKGKCNLLKLGSYGGRS